MKKLRPSKTTIILTILIAGLIAASLLASRQSDLGEEPFSNIQAS